MTPVAVLAVTLIVFAGVVAYVTTWLRSGLRNQILQREAQVLTEVASLQLATESDTLARMGIKTVPGELLNAVLKTSKLRGVFAVRVFDTQKHLSGALPFPWSEAPPAAPDWQQLILDKPIARLHWSRSAAEVIGVGPLSSPGRRPGEPLVETWLPLKRSEAEPFAGAAQMWTDGRAIATEFRELDRRLVVQATLAWAAGAAIITVLLGWAFRRLSDANETLEARSEDLLRANRELTLAAKTSALGAVTAHLMHELKNPVAGLEEFVASQSDAATRGENGGELAAASELTSRLRTMINEVASVLHDEQSGSRFELTGDEILELVTEKMRSVAARRGLLLHATPGCGASLPARRANLAILILQNLVQNAVEASPRESMIELAAAGKNGAAEFTITDSGAGLPSAVRERLFHPCTSTKRGGSGLGLAISQQLARQAGGRIELVHTGTHGTCFRVLFAAE